MRNRDRVRKFNRDTVPSGSPRTISIRAKRNRANCSLLSGKRFDATEDRSHGRPERAVKPEPRSCIRNQSRENLLKRTKIVLALPSYHRQRLSGIRRGWCPRLPLRKRGDWEGDPFRLWRHSPPVFKWAGFIDRRWPSQGETTIEETPLPHGELAFRATPQSGPRGRGERIRTAADSKYPARMEFYPGIIDHDASFPPSRAAALKVCLRFTAQ